MFVLFSINKLRGVPDYSVGTLVGVFSKVLQPHPLAMLGFSVSSAAGISLGRGMGASGSF